MDRDEFIERQVAFQFGACRAEPGLDIAELARTEAATKPSLLFHDPATQSFVPAERGAGLKRAGNGDWEVSFEERAGKLAKRRATRDAALLNNLYAAGLRSAVLIDMHDANDETGSRFPVFQYNRLRGAKNAILWPFERIHKIDGGGFCIPPDPSESRYAEKTRAVFWRGGFRGFSTLGGEVTNIRNIVSTFLENRMDEETLIAHLQTVPRYAFVARYFNEPGFDVGFSFADTKAHLREIPALARYEKAYIPQEEQLGYRYHVSIRGTDVASNFGWQIGTNCVILRDPYPWEVFFEGHFAPWEHYVPIAADFADVPDKIEWCERNPDACQTMIEKRHTLVGFLLEPKTRRKVLRRVVRRYEDFHQQWAAS